MWTHTRARYQLISDIPNLLEINLPGAVLCPVSPAVSARAYACPAVGAGDHWPDDKLDSGNISADGAHELGRNRLVTSPDKDHGVHRRRADHLLCIHAHEISKKHRGRVRERLVQRDRREQDWQTALQHHAALDCVEQLWDIRVAWVVAALRMSTRILPSTCQSETYLSVNNTDNAPIQRVVRISRPFDERLAQEERKLVVAVVCQS